MSRRRVDREPSLREVLADPIVQLLMARDGTTRRDIDILIAAVRGRRSSKREGLILKLRRARVR